jgi:hypothetical protein
MSSKLKALTITGWVAAALYIGVGLLELALDEDESLGSLWSFILLLVVLAALVVGGIRVIRNRPWLGATVASVGALVGALVLFWTVLAILLAIAIVILSLLVARETSAHQVDSE